MSNSIQAVKDKLRNISREKNIDFNSVMRFYMYDRFVERLSKSKYKDNFILKGGFYLSKLFGLDNRSTMDIDTAIRKTKSKYYYIKWSIYFYLNPITYKQKFICSIFDFQSEKRFYLINIATAMV